MVRPFCTILLLVSTLATAYAEEPAPAVPTAEAAPAAPAVDAATAVAFADHLLESDDPFNALTWYRLGAFLGADAPSLRFRMALAYERGERHGAAEQAYLDLAGRAPDWSPRATYRAGVAALADDRFELAKLHLGEVAGEAPESVWAARSRYGIGVVALEQGRPGEAARAFETFAVQHPDSSLVVRAHATRAILEPRIPRRSPALAAAMSTLVPGTGQLYAGSYGDAVMALLANGFLVGVSATTLRYGLEQDAGWAVTSGAAIGTVAAFSWASNVLGAWRGARRANERHVRRRMDAALGEAVHPDLALSPDEVDWRALSP